jgi:hypothetical protein
MLHTNRINQRKPIQIPSCSTTQNDNACYSVIINVNKWLQIGAEYDGSITYADLVL